MNHARVKALKGNGKTVSKKAQKSGRASGIRTPQGLSPMASQLTSPSQSAAASRVTSDASDNEDDGDFDVDDMMSSVHSAGSSPEANADPGTAYDFNALLDDLRDRKHNNVEARELHLEVYIKLLRSRFDSEISQRLTDLASSLTDMFLRSANRGATARERSLSLQAYCLTVGSMEDTEVYEAVKGPLIKILVDEDDDACQIYSLYALGLTCLYGGGLEDAALELMEYFIEIVRTDGENIDAPDNAAVVGAALQAWAFLASHVDDNLALADDAMEAFVDQLDSAHFEIQANAGHCIALVYESSRRHEEETGEPFQLSFDPHRLAFRLCELSKQSSKSISRKERRDLREALTSVVTSLERGVGPFYSTALHIPERDTQVASFLRTDDGRVEYGYRCRLRLGNHTAKINTWSLYSRVNIMKILFKGGLQNHIFQNPVVTECLEDAEWSESHALIDHERKTQASARTRKR